jgi:predicted Na+-dependent transporter
MKEIIISILKIVAPLSVAFIVFSQGLGIAPSRVLGLYKEHPWLILRSMLAVLVLVPAAALAILLGLHPAPGLAIGLAILVSCPPAPLMFATAPNKGASADLMASLHLGLAALAVLTVPAVLCVLSRALGFAAEVSLGSMLWTLSRTIVLPIGAGLVVRGLFPAAADRLAPVLAKAAMIGLLVVVLFVLAALYHTLLNMDAWSYVIIVLVSLTATAIGYFAGPIDPHERIGLAIECGVRHPMVALTIASSNFTPAKAVPVLFPCILTFMLLGMVFLAIRSKVPQRGSTPSGNEA